MAESGNRYVEELMKCVGKKVVVTDTEGNEVDGVCVAISHMHLNVVIRTDTEKIIIKNIRSIRRQRTFGKKEESHA